MLGFNPALAPIHARTFTFTSTHTHQVATSQLEKSELQRKVLVLTKELATMERNAEVSAEQT